MTNYKTIETFKIRVLGAGQVSEQDLDILRMIEKSNELEAMKDVELSENYRINDVTLNLTLDNQCNMVIVSRGVEVANTGHDYKAGYKVFADACKKNGYPDWDVERFWGWAELGGGLGTPENNGYGKTY